MVEGLERFKAAPGEGLTDEVADLMGLPRPIPGASGGQPGQGGMQDGNMAGGSNEVGGVNGNQAGGMNPAAMAAMGMGMGMPMNMQDGMGMGMTPEMFNQMGQMGMDGMMGMPMMQGMQGMQGMDFAQMAGMMGGMGGMFGGQGQGMTPQQQQQMPPQMQQQLQGGGTPGQGGDPVKQEEGDVKAEGTPQPQNAQGDQSVSRIGSLIVTQSHAETRIVLQENKPNMNMQNMMQNMAGFANPDGSFPNFPGMNMNMMNGMPGMPNMPGQGDFGMPPMGMGLPVNPGQAQAIGGTTPQGQQQQGGSGPVGRNFPAAPATAPTGPAGFRGSIRGRGGAARGAPGFRGRGGARKLSMRYCRRPFVRN